MKKTAHISMSLENVSLKIRTNSDNPNLWVTGITSETESTTPAVGDTLHAISMQGSGKVKAIKEKIAFVIDHGNGHYYIIVR